MLGDLVHAAASPVVREALEMDSQCKGSIVHCHLLLCIHKTMATIDIAIVSAAILQANKSANMMTILTLSTCTCCRDRQYGLL